MPFFAYRLYEGTDESTCFLRAVPRHRQKDPTCVLYAYEPRNYARAAACLLPPTATAAAAAWLTHEGPARDVFRNIHTRGKKDCCYVQLEEELYKYIWDVAVCVCVEIIKTEAWLDNLGPIVEGLEAGRRSP
ncbi:hypothetical protein ACRALDRAFT_2020547 [Sodiomyces alcalophilus JCM 7366]|uniref:uncharacterized protein n=1 Tax=Sodiomyces alcalophilus JCM 7366 TaxID=591952 RepID=UPI0039B56939